MAKPEWGTKHVCQSCATIYYDMKKSPPTCPKCGTKFDPEALLKSRRGRTLPDEVKSPVEETEVEAEEELEDVEIEDAEDGDDDESVIEDASELGEGEDDVGLEVEGDEKDN
ncbi:MAG: TIGR02300 family protein [Bdellovibrionales bacterium]